MSDEVIDVEPRSRKWLSALLAVATMDVVGLLFLGVGLAMYSLKLAFVIIGAILFLIDLFSSLMQGLTKAILDIRTKWAS